VGSVESGGPIAPVVIVGRDRSSPSVMANTLKSTPPRPESSAFPSLRVGSKPPTGIAPACLWLLSQGAAGLSTAPSAARSWRWSQPTSWLAGLLLLALALTFGPGTFTAPPASVPMVCALLPVAAVGSFVGARQLAAIVAAVIGLPARYGLLATTSRTCSAQAYPPKRLSAR